MTEHPADAVAVSVLAVALLLPDRVSDLGPGAFVAVPAEGLLAVAVILVLPAAARRSAAVVMGALLGVLTLLKITDLCFSVVLGRSFDLLLDWPLLAAGTDFVSGAVGPAAAIGAVLLAALVAGAVLVAMVWSTLRLCHLVQRRVTAASLAVPVLAAVWVSAAGLGVHGISGMPIAAHSTATLAQEKLWQVGAGLQDRREFAAVAAADAFVPKPGRDLLGGLRGKDVMLVFVESYGRDAVEAPGLGDDIGPVLDAGTDRLQAAGFSARSAFLTSSTAGGGSWLAHATFLSGLWIDNQQRYRTLVSSDRLTLTAAFRRAGWRTVGVMPGITKAWPEASFFGYDQVYAADAVGYRGPKFSWATMPDQYTLAAFERLEHARSGRGPVMSVIPLVTSHAPWSPTPRMVPWSDVGDGSVFDGMAATADPPSAIYSRPPDRVRADYRVSIEYALASLISYVETYGDEDLVMIFLGDHSPNAIVTGPEWSRDVPITIVAKDRAVLQRMSTWGWDDGLRPKQQAPVWRMDTFRDRFLTAFGSPPRPHR